MDFLRSDTPAHQVGSTELAAALGTMGIPMLAERPWRRLSGDSEATTYFFEQKSACGQYQTKPLVRAWDDHQWQRGRPRHPLSYIRRFFQNRHRYLDWERGGISIGAIRRAEKIELITLIEGRPIRGDHNPIIDGPIVETDDLDLAMALLALGISPAPGHSWRRETRRFRFMAADPLARFAAAPLSIAWQSPDWWQSNPEHPLAYISCAAANKRWLLDQIRGTAPIAVMKGPTGHPAFLSTAAGDDAQRKFFRALRD
jgi:hypothetical protein